MPMFRKPPLLSPRPRHLGDDEEMDHPTPSGVYRMVKETKKQFKIGTATAALALIGTAGGGILEIINISRAQAQEIAAPLDAGQKILNERINNTNDRVDFLKATMLSEVEENRKYRERDEAQKQLMMDALGVPKWKRPEPLDGGK